MKMQIYRACCGVLAVLAAALLPGCKSVDVPKVPGITPYRMVIQQGNFISQEMVSQLKPGMTKEQVRFILGTPLVTDIFHAERWDYVFFRESAGGKREQRNLSVVFENNRLARVIGDLMPTEGSPQAGGFEQQIKPDARAKPEAKPEPKAEARPAARPESASAEAAQPAQNWGTTNYETKADATPAPKPEESKPVEEKKEEPGFLQRLREKMGL